MDVSWTPQTLKAQSHLTSARKGTSCSSRIPYAATTPGTLVVCAAPLATLRLQLTLVSSVSRGVSPVRIRVLSPRGEVGPMSVAPLQSYPPHPVSLPHLHLRRPGCSGHQGHLEPRRGS